MVLVQTTLDGARLEIEKLNTNVDKAKVGVKDLNDLLTTYVALARELGMPPQIMQLIRWAQQGRIAVETLMRSIQLYYATTGPLGLAIAAGGFLIGTFMLADVSTSVGDSLYDNTHGA